MKGKLTYTQVQELEDDKFFKFFNDKVKWFKPIDDDPLDCSIIDKYVYDRKGRLCAIELKKRDCHINSFDGIFIEPKKYEQLKKDFEEKNCIPIYINFFQDGEHVGMWDMRMYFNEGKEPEKVRCTINNYGYGSVDYVDRYKLPQRLCHFYKYNKNTDRFEKRW